MTLTEFDAAVDAAGEAGDLETLEALYAAACAQIGGEPGRFDDSELVELMAEGGIR